MCTTLPVYKNFNYSRQNRNHYVLPRQPDKNSNYRNRKTKTKSSFKRKAPRNFPKPKAQLFHNNQFVEPNVFRQKAASRKFYQMRANLRKIKTRAIWVRKDDLLPQMKCNIVITALKAEHTSSGWYLDSGCSKHMTGDGTKLLNKTRFAGGKVVFGDRVSSQIIGKGILKEEGMPVLGKCSFS